MRAVDDARRSLRLFAMAARVALRGAGWIFLALTILALCAGAYAYRLFSPEKARALAIEQLKAALGREVEIERLVLTPGGLKLRGLRVLGATAGAEDFLVCDTALVTFRLKPLLRRRLEFGTILLSSPRIAIAREADGRWDFADIFLTTRPARGGLPLALASAETEIQDGVLRVDDRLRARSVSLAGLSARVYGFDTDSEFPVSLGFSGEVVIASRAYATTVVAEGRMNLAGLEWPSATARADRLTVRVQGIEATGTAGVDGFFHPRVSFAAELPGLGPEQWDDLFGRDWRVALPATSWEGSVFFPDREGMTVESLSMKTPAGVFTATGTVNWAGASPVLHTQFSAKDVELDKTIAWHPSGAARALKGLASMRAVVDGWFGRLQIREGDLSLRGFGAIWGTMKFEDVALDAAAFEEFASFKVEVAGGKAAGFGNTFDSLAAGISVKGRALSLERATLRWGASRVKLRGRVDNLSAPKEVAISGTMDRLVWEDAQKLVLGVRAAISTRTAADADQPWVGTFKYSIPRGFPNTVGHLKIDEVTQANFNCRNLDLLWDLRGLTPGLEKASGDARLSFGPGRVSDIPAVQESHSFLRVVFLPFIFMHKMNNLSVFSAATAYPKTLDFQRIEGEYGATRGAATTRYFHVDSGQLAAYAEGVADFAKEQVDMTILTRLTSFRGTLPEWWVDESGRPAIGFRVKGDMNKPDLEPRLRKLESDAIEKALDEGRKRAKTRFSAIEKLRTL